jgi:hypothetical protein
MKRIIAILLVVMLLVVTVPTGIVHAAPAPAVQTGPVELNINGTSSTQIGSSSNWLVKADITSTAHGYIECLGVGNATAILPTNGTYYWGWGQSTFTGTVGGSLSGSFTAWWVFKGVQGPNGALNEIGTITNGTGDLKNLHGIIELKLTDQGGGLWSGTYSAKTWFGK